MLRLINLFIRKDSLRGNMLGIVSDNDFIGRLYENDSVKFILNSDENINLSEYNITAIIVTGSIYKEVEINNNELLLCSEYTSNKTLNIQFQLSLKVGSEIVRTNILKYKFQNSLSGDITTPLSKFINIVELGNLKLDYNEDRTHLIVSNKNDEILLDIDLEEYT